MTRDKWVRLIADSHLRQCGLEQSGYFQTEEATDKARDDLLSTCYQLLEQDGYSRLEAGAIISDGLDLFIDEAMQMSHKSMCNTLYGMAADVMTAKEAAGELRI